MKREIILDSTFSIEYDNTNFLNKGNYADVYKAYVIKHNNNRVSKNFLKKLLKSFACRVNDKKCIEDRIDEMIIKLANKKMRCGTEQINNEIRCLLELKDEPHIIHIKHAIMGEIYKNYNFIGLECCDGGDLFNYFANVHNGHLNEQEVQVIIHQLIEAIEECHKHKIVHGDIKLENIGLVRKGDVTELKLLDFGGAHKIEHPEDEREYHAYEFHLTASLHYLAPEFVSSEFLIKERELIYTDFWELGVLCYILLTGAYPFHGANKKTTYKEILEKEIKWPGKTNVSNKMKEFTQNLLKKKPQERILLHI